MTNAGTGEVRAVLAADTTITLGGGRPFTPADKAFIAEVSSAAGRCLQAMDVALADYAVKADDAHSPPPEPVEGDDADAEAAPAEAIEEAAAEAPSDDNPAVGVEAAKAALGAAAAEVAAVQFDAVDILRLYQVPTD